jgi:hypothetical protein
MEKIGSKVKRERLCNFLAVYLGIFTTLSQDTTANNANVTYQALVMYFHWKKNPAYPRLAQLRKLHLKLLNFFQPPGFVKIKSS